MIAAKRIHCSTPPKRPGRYPLAARRSRLAVHRHQDQGTRGYSGTAETWARPHTDVTVAAGGAVAPAGAVVRTPSHGRARPPPLARDGAAAAPALAARRRSQGACGVRA